MDSCNHTWAILGPYINICKKCGLAEEIPLALEAKMVMEKNDRLTRDVLSVANNELGGFLLQEK